MFPVYMCVHLIYIYIYIHRERKRERAICSYVCYVYIHMNIVVGNTTVAGGCPWLLLFPFVATCLQIFEALSSMSGLCLVRCSRDVV